MVDWADTARILVSSSYRWLTGLTATESRKMTANQHWVMSSFNPSGHVSGRGSCRLLLPTPQMIADESTSLYGTSWISSSHSTTPNDLHTHTHTHTQCDNINCQLGDICLHHIQQPVTKTSKLSTVSSEDKQQAQNCLKNTLQSNIFWPPAKQHLLIIIGPMSAEPTTIEASVSQPADGCKNTHLFCWGRRCLLTVSRVFTACYKSTRMFYYIRALTVS